MCLLVDQTASTKFTDEFLKDVFHKNSDGLGIMYPEDGLVHIMKCLPKTADEFVSFYRLHAEGRDCVWHARMQTHGDIDLDNCHPYKVTENIWMAHNGILATGNDADETRSDTWHYINWVVRPTLMAHPDLLSNPDYIKFLGKMIGSSNKLAFVNGNGEITVINQSAGVQYLGSWLSNTYAWSYLKFTGAANVSTGYNYSTTKYNWRKGTYFDDGYDIQDGYDLHDGYSSIKHKSQPSATQVASHMRAAHNSYTNKKGAGVLQWVKDAPHKAGELLAHYFEDDDYDFEEMAYSDPDETSMWIVDLIETDSFPAYALR